MVVEITPRGTRGMSIPRLPPPMMKLLDAVLRTVRRLQRTPLLSLTTTGAKSGLQRTTTLRRFDVDADTWMVVASFGGAAGHPDWYFNMAKHPDQVWVDVDGSRSQVTPSSLSGAERDPAWARVVAEAPEFANYQVKTDRQLPVVLLRRQR